MSKERTSNKLTKSGRASIQVLPVSLGQPVDDVVLLALAIVVDVLFAVDAKSKVQRLTEMRAPVVGKNEPLTI